MFSAPSEVEASAARKRVAGVWSGWMPWVGKGMLAVADQGLISSSNFLLGVVLARWLGAEQYGAYALAFSILLLLSGFHQALLVEPMSVLGPSLYRGRRREYLGALLWIHTGIGLAIFAVLGVATILAHRMAPNSGLTGALAGLALASPCILLFWLVRSASYLEVAPGPAAAAAGLYSLVLLGALLMVYRVGLLSAGSVFLLMAFGAVAASGFLVARLRPQVKLGASGTDLKEVWRRHWGYGRWSLLTTVVTWTPENIFYALVGALLGMGGAGALKSMTNLLLPMGHIAAALARLIQPKLSGIFGQEGLLATEGPVKKITWLTAAGAVAYLLFVSLFSERIFYFLYGGRFIEFAHLLPWAVVGGVFSVACQGPCMGLRAMQSPYSVFVTYCAAAAVSIVVGVPATWRFGLQGAIGGSIASSLTALAVATLVFHRKVRRASEAGASPG